MAKEKCLLCDLDGTLALIGSRSPYDASRCDELDSPNTPVVETVRALVMNGYDVVFVSGREDKYEPQTRRFIAKCFPDFKFGYELYMRKSGDMRKDAIVKKEIWENKIEHRYDILLSLDDRDQVVSLWRSLKIPCFQVAPGSF